MRTAAHAAGEGAFSGIVLPLPYARADNLLHQAPPIP